MNPKHSTSPGWLGKLRRVACSLLLFSAGCSRGTETGNPPEAMLELGVTGFSDDYPSVAVGLAGPGLSIERAFVALRSVELRACSGAGGVRFGDLSSDLVAPAAVRSTTSDASEFCGAEVNVGSIEDPEHGELAGRSVYVQGKRGDGLPFELASSVETRVILDSDPPLTPFAATRLLLAFNLATWFAGADVAGAEATDGLVRIDAASNPLVLEAFELATPLAPALYDDADGDGQLEGDAQPPAAGP